MEIITERKIDFTKITHDVNGNQRYVCHFLAFINKGDKIKADTCGMRFISEQYEIALKKSRELGGRKFHNKQYGGGIVFQSYNTDRLQDRIQELKEVNTNFKTEWTREDFKKAKRAIYRHFVTYTYKWQSTHEKESRVNFHPFNFQDIDNKLGLAYTSTGAYAGLWVCNGGYMMANETHHFTGFMINEKGQVIGCVEDKNENEIFIEL